MERNAVSRGADTFTAWSCLRCGFAGGDLAAMPLAWSLRFYLLRMKEAWNGYGAMPPMDRDRNAEQVQAKRDALALLEGLGGKIRPIRKSPGGTREGMDGLANGPRIPGQRDFGAAFGRPKAKRKRAPKASGKYGGY